MKIKYSFFEYRPWRKFCGRFIHIETGTFMAVQAAIWGEMCRKFLMPFIRKEDVPNTELTLATIQNCIKNKYY